MSTHTIDEGYPKRIGPYWAGMTSAGFDNHVDSALSWSDKWLYFFKDGQYVQYNRETDTVDAGYPKPVTRHWEGFEGGFGRRFDAFVRWDWAYAFHGDQYLRFWHRKALLAGRAWSTPWKPTAGGQGRLGR